MFKKHTVNISLSKNKKKPNDSAPGEDKILHPESVQLVAEKSKEVVKYVALTVVGAYAAFKFIDTLSQIAVKKTKSADENQ